MSDNEIEIHENLPVGYGPRIIGFFIILGFVALTLAAIFTFVTGALSLTAAFAMSMVAVGCSIASFLTKIYYDYTYRQEANWTNYYRENQHSSLALGIGSIILAIATIVAIIFLTGGLYALGTHGIQGISSSVIKAMSGIQTAIEFAGSILALGALLYTGTITITDRKAALDGYELISQGYVESNSAPSLPAESTRPVPLPKTASPDPQLGNNSSSTPSPSPNSSPSPTNP